MRRGFAINKACLRLAATVISLIVALTLSSTSQAQGPALTTVSDTVYRADGTAAAGTVLISWPSFQTSEGDAVAAGNLAVTLGTAGSFTAQLVPNVGASPAGTYYVVVFQLDDGTVRTEYWAVPATSPTTIAGVLTTPGTGLGNLSVTQGYVNAAVAAENATVVHLAGAETITGTKQFTAPPSLPAPVAATDAANKSYVDTAVSNVGSGAYVAIAGGAMTGPLVLPADPTSPNQAADRNYVDNGLAAKANLVNGTVPPSELGGGVASSATCLNGNSTWGTCGGGAPAGISYATTALNWTQTISNSLTGGTQATVTLTPCPVGIDTSGIGLYQISIFVSGQGLQETQQVTGGSCTSGASSGTVVFTPFASYSAGYTIASATSGVQETWNSACGTLSRVTNNGYCNVILPANNTVNNSANSYGIYGTLFLHGAQATLSGYGAKFFCVGRTPCIQVGDLNSADNYVSVTVQGLTFNSCGHTCGSQYPDYTTSAAYAGVNITNTVTASGVQTITTATPHGFRLGDMVTILFTDNSAYWGDCVVQSVPSTTTLTCKGSGTIASQATPGVVALAFVAVLDNASNTHLTDLTYDFNNGAGRFNNFFDFWDDENATVEHFDNNGYPMNGSLTWAGSFIFSGGAAHAPNGGQQFAPVITVRDSTITANYSNCVTDYNSNGLYFDNTVCQATGLWELYSATTRGNYQGAEITNIYSENAVSDNPSGSGATTPFPGLGIAGAIFGASGPGHFSIKGGTGVGGGFASGGTGSTPYTYYIVAHDSTESTVTSPMQILNWASTGSDSIPVKWPRMANGADTITYDVIRMASPSANTATPPSYNGTPYPAYNESCPGGSGGTCGSVATGLSQSTACSGLVCTYTDTGSSTTAAYSVNNGNWYGQLNFWPGALVVVANTNAPVDVDTEQGPMVGIGLSGGAIQSAKRCSANTIASPGGYDTCFSATIDGYPNQPALLLPDGFPGERMVPSKGRINFLDTGSALDPHHIITLLDSQPGLTQASPNYRPPASANDVWIGTDVAPASGFMAGQLAFGAPVAITNYIAQIGDGVHANWLERLSASLKEFNVPVKFDQSVTIAGLANGCLNIASGAIASTGSACGTGGSGGSVSSVFGRSGAVVAASGDYTVAQVTGAAVDADVVHNTGNETIAGTKTFTTNVTLTGDLVLPEGLSYVPPVGGIGLDTAAGLPVVNIAGTTEQIALTNSNTSGQAGTALALAATPTQCTASFATGIAANGDANCSVADVLQLHETTPPAGIANWGVLWFDSSYHAPFFIDNNGQAVQLGLTNLFNSDPGNDAADNLEERNGPSGSENFRVYSSYTNTTDWARISLGFDSTDNAPVGYAVLRSENSTSASAAGLGLWVGSGLKWAVDPTGTFKPWTDNEFNLGSDSGNAAKSVFAKTSFNSVVYGRHDFEIPNDAVTGTVVNKLAVFNSDSPSQSVVAGTSSTNGVIGLVQGGAGTSGDAVVTWQGYGYCIFDGMTTAGDAVVASTTTAGDCHDTGSGGQPGVQLIGYVDVSNSTSGQTNGMRVSLQAPPGSGGGGSVSSVFGRTGAVTSASEDYTVGQVTGAAVDSAVVHLAGTETISGAKTFSSDVTLSGNLNVAGNINQTSTGPTQWSGQEWTGTTVTVPGGMAFSLGVGSDSTFHCQLAGGGSCTPVGAVASVFGRSGAVVAGSGDYSVAQVTGAAPLASPTFTGTPSAPTANAGDNSTKLATTAFVAGAIPANSTSIPWLTFPHGGSNINFSTGINKAIFTGIILDFAKTTSQVSYNVSAVDNTSNTYDLGVYSGTSGGTCTQVAHIGSAAGTTFATSTGWKTTSWTGGSVTLQPGRYYLGYTTSCSTSCATLVGDTGGFTFAGNSGGTNSNVSISAGGTLPATATCPTDGYSTTSAPNWAIN